MTTTSADRYRSAALVLHDVAKPGIDLDTVAAAVGDLLAASPQVEIRYPDAATV
ncbi:MAG TPA: hypothetical protein VK917_06075 [Ilumatobacter sp.]|nr:hypothetical protein [Ilumatobacter sp.]